MSTTSVYPIDLLLKKAKHVVMVYDRIPPGFMTGYGSHFTRAVQQYRLLMDWKDKGISLVKITYGPDPVVGFNQPYSEFYIWMSRLALQNLEMKPVA